MCFLLCFQVVGLQFFSVDAVGSRNITVKYKVYFLVLLSLVAVSWCAQLKILPQVQHGDDAKAAVQKSLENLSFLGVYFTAFLILFQAYFSTPKNWTILDNFNKISSLSWNKSYFYVDYSLFRIRFGKKFTGFLAYYLVTYTLPIIIQIIYIPRNDTSI